MQVGLRRAMIPCSLASPLPYPLSGSTRCPLGKDRHAPGLSCWPHWGQGSCVRAFAALHSTPARAMVSICPIGRGRRRKQAVLSHLQGLPQAPQCGGWRGSLPALTVHSKVRDSLCSVIGLSGTPRKRLLKTEFKLGRTQGGSGARFLSPETLLLQNFGKSLRNRTIESENRIRESRESLGLGVYSPA